MTRTVATCLLLGSIAACGGGDPIDCPPFALEHRAPAGQPTSGTQLTCSGALAGSSLCGVREAIAGDFNGGKCGPDRTTVAVSPNLGGYFAVYADADLGAGHAGATIVSGCDGGGCDTQVVDATAGWVSFDDRTDPSAPLTGQLDIEIANGRISGTFDTSSH